MLQSSLIIPLLLSIVVSVGCSGGTGSGSAEVAGSPAAGSGTATNSTANSGGGSGGSTTNPNAGGVANTSDFVAGTPSAECRSVRLTTYVSSANQSACGWFKNDPYMPDFVRVQRMTAAMAQSWWGGSYVGPNQGLAGDTCGECWEITTYGATRIVMIDDWCPADGNPLCASTQFHIDLAETAATALASNGLDAATARPVPCPVAGNLFAVITDWNQWGYTQFPIANARIPVRNVEFKPVGSSQWTAMSRNAGTFQNTGAQAAFATGASGATLRITSAQGEVVESNVVLAPEFTIGQYFDLGVQFQDIQGRGAGGSCAYHVPGDVYIDGWGSSASVPWKTWTYGGFAFNEVSTGCFNDSASCLHAAMTASNGVQIAWEPVFAIDTFSTLNLQIRTTAGSGDANVGIYGADGQCKETVVPITTTWKAVTIDIASTCSGVTTMYGLTLGSAGANLDVLVDDIRFVGK